MSTPVGERWGAGGKNLKKVGGKISGQEPAAVTFRWGMGKSEKRTNFKKENASSSHQREEKIPENLLQRTPAEDQ